MFDLTKSVLVTFGVKQVYSAFDYQRGFENFCHISPDLVIMDWLDDPLNALELTKKIRTDPASPNPYAPIILMSGYSLKERVLKARDSGITCFMAKPYTAKALYTRIEQLVERPRQFVRSEDFFGPDRRSERSSTYTGEERRSRPSSTEDPTTPNKNKK